MLPSVEVTCTSTGLQTTNCYVWVIPFTSTYTHQATILIKYITIAIWYAQKKTTHLPLNVLSLIALNCPSSFQVSSCHCMPWNGHLNQEISGDTKDQQIHEYLSLSHYAFFSVMYTKVEAAVLLTYTSYGAHKGSQSLIMWMRRFTVPAQVCTGSFSPTLNQPPPAPLKHANISFTARIEHPPTLPFWTRRKVQRAFSKQWIQGCIQYQSYWEWICWS